MNNSITCGRFQLSLDMPLIMGIVNLTDDSFSGDGLRGRVDSAIEQGLKMIEEGANLLDLGAESSRPGASPITAAQEVDRLLPVIEGLRDAGVPLSVDTAKPEVMRTVIAAGADMINDIGALQAPGALATVAESPVAVCLMHMRGEPKTMQENPAYLDVISEVTEFLEERIFACISAGIARKRIVIDPGFGFGKVLDHNLKLLGHLQSFAALDAPILAGMSRKSMLGAVTGRPVQERLPASIAAVICAVDRGAQLLRVHDVAATRDALAVWNAIRGA